MSRIDRRGPSVSMNVFYALQRMVDILLFADDVKLFSVIKSPNDALKLQSNLDKFVVWSFVNRLPLNMKKCSVITFSHLNNIITYNYMIDNFSVKRVTSIRELGILFQFNMDFYIHINIYIKKAFKFLGFINRSTVNLKNANFLET